MDEDASPAGRKPRVKDEDIIEVFWNAETPILSTSEIAEELPITKRGTFDRLSKLEEEEKISSKIFPAGGAEVRLWWHNTVTEVPQAWSQSSPTSNKIGIEVVDNLNLAGDGDTLKKRRHAVSTVFKYLFIKGEAQSSELRNVAWAANTNNTYGSQDGLWNNCVSKALSQTTSLFAFYKEDNTWRLTTFGNSIKGELGENSLWENWAENKRLLTKAVFRTFWERFNEFVELNDTALQISDPAPEDTHTTGFRDFDSPLVFQLELQREIWLELAGTLYSHLQIRDDEETIRRLIKNQETIQTELDIPTTWNKLDDADKTILQISTTKQVELDPSRIDIRQRTNGSKGEYLPIQDPQWVIEVAENFHQVFHDRIH
jgi:hypothetical protein